MLFETIAQLATHIDPGNKFIVENGRWTGHVKYKDTDGITIDMYDQNNILARQNVFMPYSHKCEWYILRLTKTVNEKEEWYDLI